MSESGKERLRERERRKNVNMRRELESEKQHSEDGETDRRGKVTSGKSAQERAAYRIRMKEWKGKGRSRASINRRRSENCGCFSVERRCRV